MRTHRMRPSSARTYLISDPLLIRHNTHWLRQPKCILWDSLLKSDIQNGTIRLPLICINGILPYFIKLDLKNETSVFLDVRVRYMHCEANHLRKMCVK